MVETSVTYAIVSLSSNVLYTRVLQSLSLNILRYYSVILKILKGRDHETYNPKDVFQLTIFF